MNKKEKNNGAKKKLSPKTVSWVLVLFALVGIIDCIMGIKMLIENDEGNIFGELKRDTHASGEVNYAVLLHETKHTLYGIIPLGSDYYYLVLDETANNYCVVRAGKSWYEDNFDRSGRAIHTVKIKGYVAILDASITSFNFKKIQSNLNDYNIELDNYYVDILYIGVAIKKIISGILLAVGFLMILYGVRLTSKQPNEPHYLFGSKNEDDKDAKFIIGGVIVIFVWLCLSGILSIFF
ncbi:MAG: hypothetical protein K2G45_05960 [Lachnospiraceae bacterium]|nr:hypothetical protein [Lachnospiraceae bacterium]